MVVDGGGEGRSEPNYNYLGAYRRERVHSGRNVIDFTERRSKTRGRIYKPSSDTAGESGASYII